MLADLVVVPMPDVIEQTPNHICIALYHFVLAPQVPTWKAWEIFQVRKHLVEVGVDARQILRRSVQAFYDLIFTAEAI